MVYYNCVRYPVNCRMSTPARCAANKKFADFIKKVFGNETHLTKELILERLKIVNSVYSFARVMRFLCKQGRVLRRFWHTFSRSFNWYISYLLIFIMIFIMIFLDKGWMNVRVFIGVKLCLVTFIFSIILLLSLKENFLIFSKLKLISKIHIKNKIPKIISG